MQPAAAEDKTQTQDMIIDIINVLLIAFGLSVDSFHISLAVGTFFPHSLKIDKIKMITAFMLFHFVMMTLGWSIGANIVGYIETAAHWIVLAFLGFIGGKFIWEAIKGDDDDDVVKENFFSLKNIAFLGFVTSLDALAIGFSFALNNKSIFIPNIVICAVVGAMTLLGLTLGSKLNKVFPTKILKILAGVVLILIGIYPVAEHYIN